MYVATAALILSVAGTANAQMSGAPVLQNAWASPGIVVAANFAGGSGSSLFAGAVGWAPASGRFQLSGGVGSNRPATGDRRLVYGARAAFPLMQAMAGRLGVAGFAGIGGGAVKATEPTVSKTHVPVGVAVGYRQAIGTAGRGVSGYVDPMYQFHRAASGNKGYFRLAGGVDLGISPRFGLTFGFESGAKAGAGEAGPSGGVYGIGVSMKLGR